MERSGARYILYVAHLSAATLKKKVDLTEEPKALLAACVRASNLDGSHTKKMLAFNSKGRTIDTSFDLCSWNEC